ncbi:FAD/NAD(P)-binding domain-containing protein [Xylaria bambusicola]|uniref:FAD/NAD(P)-binding domain-containing protein n=1 Tax=Xylaria bambusicola TaxID=326684 RepID=UPI0020072BD3|nr:FAD/NAD(P)-binding domain-containing protein [Xylaria bambusicola]KAI0508580.1 FAD/NAD(P)-binding domain-containing protein [Xylaria bambusicola]
MAEIYDIGKDGRSACGFPGPTVQQPTPDKVLNDIFFMSEENWDDLGSLNAYDYVVVGSGCTALAFVHETLQLNPHKKILIIERGGFLLPTHFQNLSAPFQRIFGGHSVIYPWTLSGETYNSDLGYCHGFYPFFGGRSLFWSGWCPQPSMESLREYPDSMKNTAANSIFWARAQELLNITSLAEIKDSAFGCLQGHMSSRLDFPIDGIPSLRTTGPALLATSHKRPGAQFGFSKFSAVEKLLSIIQDQIQKASRGEGKVLDVKLNCAVRRIIVNRGDAIGLETVNGTKTLDSSHTKLILCAGTIPNTTLLYNSIPQMAKETKRLTGNFISHLTFRVPRSQIPCLSHGHSRSLEIAAQCLLGLHPSTGRQYQIQITAVHCPDVERDLHDLGRKCPDFSASAQANQLRGSEDHVIFVCAAVGEFSEQNSRCWIRRNEGDPDKTTNIRIQYLCNEEDEALRTFMEEVVFQLADRLSKPSNRDYWNKLSQTWVTGRPSQQEMRVRGVVHESSSTFMGPESEGGSVDELYRPYGCNGVYVTGGGIFPTAGAWNPTLAMCAFAQDLARKLNA